MRRRACKKTQLIWKDTSYDCITTEKEKNMQETNNQPQNTIQCNRRFKILFSY